MVCTSVGHTGKVMVQVEFLTRNFAFGKKKLYVRRNSSQLLNLNMNVLYDKPSELK